MKGDLVALSPELKNQKNQKLCKNQNIKLLYIRSCPSSVKLVCLLHPGVIKLDCIEDYFEVDEINVFEPHDLDGLLLGHLHGN